jgi:peptidoglycan/xylan/chitin deacetylase (PgdA/CDA1 family)
VVELSVVIPTRDRPAYLRACLAALARQRDVTGDVEVLVVDDGSEHDVEPALAGWPGGPVRLLRQANAGPGAARNRGAREARGRVLLFLDDDVVGESELVAGHQAAHRDGDRIVGLGHMTLRPTGAAGPSGRNLREWWASHYQKLAEQTDRPTFMDAFTGNMSVTRVAFVEAGGFAEDLPHSEDVELGYRLHALGLRFVYLPRAVGHQEFTKGFVAFVGDAEASGRAAVELYRRHPPMLPAMPLGAYAQAGLKERAARRLTLAVPGIRALIRVMEPTIGRSIWRRRWYGFVLRASYWAGVRSTVERAEWARLTSGTTVLLYHGFSEDGATGSRWIVPVRRFAAQLAWLRRRGFVPLEMDEWLRLRAAHQLPPARSFVVTMDDGYEDTQRLALPILRRSGVTGAVFLITGLVGRSNGWDDDPPLAGRPLFGWPEARAMERDGITIGAHSRTHRSLPGLSAAEISDEVAGSRDDLERELGHPVTSFAYPYGDLDPEALAAVRRAGFTAAFGTRPGACSPAESDFALRRVTVYGTDSLLRFALVMWSGDSRWIRRLALRPLGDRGRRR